MYKVIFMAGFKQLVSAGGDGLVKVWTMRSGECETTLDNHADRVWSLALTENENVLPFEFYLNSRTSMPRW